MRGDLTLVTGATSGIGRLVTDRLAHDATGTLIVSGPDRRGTQGVARATGADGFAADLSSLDQVEQLAEYLLAQERPVKLLILAAGTQARDDALRTCDGFEHTFAVNTLSNVALIDRLIEAGRTPQRVILFSSGTHDPKKKAGLPTPGHADAALFADPERDRDLVGEAPSHRGNRAYTASKLALAMLAASYARAVPGMQIDAIDPQLTPGTELARRQSSVVRFLWHYILPGIAPIVPFMNRPAVVADATVVLASNEAIEQGSGRYVEVRNGKPVVGAASALARDVAAQDKMLADVRRLIDAAPRTVQRAAVADGN